MTKNKILYLAAYKAYHGGWDIDYQDIDGKRDIGGDMMDVDIEPYDLVIATPPCNYWSRANYRRDTSEYSQQTKHLLPAILEKLINSGKLFIVENVRSEKMFKKAGILDLQCYVYYIGRHTYWTNIYLSDGEIEALKRRQTKDFTNEKGWTTRLKKNSQGGDNVHTVIEYLLWKSLFLTRKIWRDL